MEIRHSGELYAASCSSEGSRIIGDSEAKYYQISFQEEEFLSVLQEICPEISKIERERILTLSTCNEGGYLIYMKNRHI